ncbi:hypothetical protein Rt10032_c01g0554 [Rhodotorula toruloides]|uniref:Uncharacterized protein n=1 Tax=Rhodotorula toruloides TaxID=5286 RepID=A0A511K894_RHOTO|nr:hypothetical protein Rt10032_c01g0554 [Rhodotorula toruloides]
MLPLSAYAEEGESWDADEGLEIPSGSLVAPPPDPSFSLSPPSDSEASSTDASGFLDDPQDLFNELDEEWLREMPPTREDENASSMDSSRTNTTTGTLKGLMEGLSLDAEATKSHDVPTSPAQEADLDRSLDATPRMSKTVTMRGSSPLSLLLSASSCTERGRVHHLGSTPHGQAQPVDDGDWDQDLEGLDALGLGRFGQSADDGFKVVSKKGSFASHISLDDEDDERASLPEHSAKRRVSIASFTDAEDNGEDDFDIPNTLVQFKLSPNLLLNSRTSSTSLRSDVSGAGAHETAASLSPVPQSISLPPPPRTPVTPTLTVPMVDSALTTGSSAPSSRGPLTPSRSTTDDDDGPSSAAEDDADFFNDLVLPSYFLGDGRLSAVFTPPTSEGEPDSDHPSSAKKVDLQSILRAKLEERGGRGLLFHAPATTPPSPEEQERLQRHREPEEHDGADLAHELRHDSAEDDAAWSAQQMRERMRTISGARAKEAQLAKEAREARNRIGGLRRTMSESKVPALPGLRKVPPPGRSSTTGTVGPGGTRSRILTLYRSQCHSAPWTASCTIRRQSRPSSYAHVELADGQLNLRPPQHSEHKSGATVQAGHATSTFDIHFEKQSLADPDHADHARQCLSPDPAHQTEPAASARNACGTSNHRTQAVPAEPRAVPFACTRFISLSSAILGESTALEAKLAPFAVAGRGPTAFVRRTDRCFRFTDRLLRPTVASASKTRTIPRPSSPSKPSLSPSPRLPTASALVTGIRLPSASVVLSRPLNSARKAPPEYGDGTELDAFDDLPVSKERERERTILPSSRKSSGASTATIRGGSWGKKEGSKAAAAAKTAQSGPKGRLSVGSAPAKPKRTEPEKKKVKKRREPHLIRHLGGASTVKVQGEMTYNPLLHRWEGNEAILREFDKALATWTRPALISPFSSALGSPARGQFGPAAAVSAGQAKATVPAASSLPPGATANASRGTAKVVGDMVFDPATCSWHAIAGPDAEDELEIDWGVTSGGEVADNEEQGAASELDGWELGERERMLKNRASFALEEGSEGDEDDWTIDGKKRTKLTKKRLLKESQQAAERCRREMKGWTAQADGDEGRRWLWDLRSLILGSQ